MYQHVRKKLKPLVIGKSLKPRCLKGIDVGKLPVDWKANSKVWMTTNIMIDWLQRLDQQMKSQNRKILLFFDNATSHAYLDLDNVALIFPSKHNINFSTFRSRNNSKFQNFLLQVRTTTHYCESGGRSKCTRPGKAN